MRRISVALIVNLCWFAAALVAAGSVLLLGVGLPAAVLAGQDDEVFVAARFAQVFTDAGRPDIPVTLVPGTGHIMLTVSPAARAAAVQAVERLDGVAGK